MQARARQAEGEGAVTLQELIAAARSEVGSDQSDAVLTARAQGRYKRMVTRARWRMVELAVGSTVAGQARYPLSDDVVDLDGILVGSVPYERVGVKVLWQLRSGDRALVGPGGVFGPGFDTDGGAPLIDLYPAPTANGEAITGLAAMVPPDLSSAQSPDMPVDLHHYLVNGMAADELARDDERLDDAQWHETRFEEGVRLLSYRKNSRIGSGPSQIMLSVPY